MTPLSVKEITVSTTPECCTKVNVTLLPGKDFVVECFDEEFVKSFGASSVYFTPESFEAVNWDRISTNTPLLKEVYLATREQVLCYAN